MNHSPYIIAVCGIKNSGKTTFIETMVPLFTQRGIRVGVLKHDGHNFRADVPGTDSYRFLQAGSIVSAVYDQEKCMVTFQGLTDPEHILSIFPNVDLIILEGFKNSSYDKLEIVRKGNSSSNICKGTTLKGVITDFDPVLTESVPVFPLNHPIHTVDYILQLRIRQESHYHSTIKLMLHGNSYFFGPGTCELLHRINKLGSIRKAAIDMEMSYTKAWKMINRVEEATGIRFLVRNSGGKKGGSSVLTEEAEQFLTSYEKYTDEMTILAERSFHKYFHFLE